MNKKIQLFLALCAAGLAGCAPDLSDDPIPFVAFEEIVVNLSLPQYQSLKIDGGHMYLDGGVRGIIVYRENATTFHAFERNCSFQPTEACATVDVDISGLYLIDPCCGSTFSFGGVPLGGVAWRPLREYRSSVTSEVLTITDLIAE